MACNYPVRAYRLQNGEVVFDQKKGRDIVADLTLPCGQCLGCKLERSRQWAIRCMNEASLYEQNCFVTLTFNNEHLPDNGSLEYGPFQLFMKRLRKNYEGTTIRFYMCGEYGETGDRPHYHACLFNINFEDRKYFKTTSTGSKLFTSKILEKLWPFGWATIGDVNFESAAYVARYIMKKSNGKGGMINYQTIDMETGEVGYKNKEFNKMSLKPGIGKGWYDRWKADMFPHDHVIVKGMEMKPPKYYYLMLKKENPEMYEDVGFKREKRAREKRDDNTEERLLVKEDVLKAKLKLLKRELKE